MSMSVSMLSGLPCAIIFERTSCVCGTFTHSNTGQCFSLFEDEILPQHFIFASLHREVTGSTGRHAVPGPTTICDIDRDNLNFYVG